MTTVFVCLSLLLELTCAYVYIRDALTTQQGQSQRIVLLLFGTVFSSIAMLLAYYLLIS